MLSLTPWYARLAALLALSAALVAFGWVKGERHGEAKLTAYQIAQQQVEIKERAAAATITQQRQERTDDALQQASARAQRNEAAAASARSVADGLRTDLAQARSDLSHASADAVRQYADAASAVLSDCTAEVERLAKAADGHASDTLTLEQAWPR